jgi:hypothetical protein
MSREQALARLAAIGLIESVAFLVCFAPLLVTDHREFALPAVSWRFDCACVGAMSAVVAVLLIFSSLVWAVWQPWHEESGKRITTTLERIVAFIYFWNVLSLSVAIARTGGPTTSLYGPLIAIQLSVMLLLELQKESVTKKRSEYARWYFAAGFVAWLLLAFLHEVAPALYLWRANVADENLALAQSTPAFLLTTVGMILGYLTYELPKWESLQNRFARLGRTS